MTTTEQKSPKLRMDLPPGFVGMPVSGDDETNAGYAWVVGERVAGSIDKTAQQFGSYLMALAPKLKENGIRLVGKFAVGDTPEYVATLTMAVSRWPDADPELLASKRESVAGALVAAYLESHPEADARLVRLPIGPAMAAVEAGEFRLPPAYTGLDETVVRPEVRAEYQIPLPDGESVLILAVAAQSETGWPAIAEQTAVVAHSVRMDLDGEKDA